VRRHRFCRPVEADLLDNFRACEEADQERHPPIGDAQRGGSALENPPPAWQPAKRPNRPYSPSPKPSGACNPPRPRPNYPNKSVCPASMALRCERVVSLRSSRRFRRLLADFHAINFRFQPCAAARPRPARQAAGGSSHLARGYFLQKFFGDFHCGVLKKTMSVTLRCGSARSMAANSTTHSKLMRLGAKLKKT